MKRSKRVRKYLKKITRMYAPTIEEPNVMLVVAGPDGRKGFIHCHVHTNMSCPGDKIELLAQMLNSECQKVDLSAADVAEMMHELRAGQSSSSARQLH